MNLIECTSSRDRCYEADNKFLIWQIQSGDSKILTEIESDDGLIIAHVLVLEGWLEIEYRKQTHRLTKNDFGHFIHGEKFTLRSYSVNVKAYIMISTESFNTILFKNTPPLPFSLVTKALKDPVTSLSSKMMSVLSCRIHCILEIASDVNHIFRMDMIRSAMLMFLMDMSDIYIRCGGGEKDALTGKKKDLIVKFLNLLRHNIRENRFVGFYAAELGVSQQYLNRIVKAHTERTAYDWICTTLVGEIANMLEYTNESMSQITKALNFSDQATLCKFFKHHTGYAPTEYRNIYNVK